MATSAALRSQPCRHLVSLGPVTKNVVASAARVWRADLVNGPLAAKQTLLILYDVQRTSPSEFVEFLVKADGFGLTFGVLPIYALEATPPDWARVLGYDSLSIRLSHSRFRMGGSPQTGDPRAPSILRRAACDNSEAVADDLDNADLLFLQGHSGPVDGSFGRMLTLCGRELRRSDEAGLFPCSGTGRCFRQASQGRAETSSEGLVDPRRIKAPLLVADGCGTFPVPGSIYAYEQTLLRGLMLGHVRAAVLSMGISATPMSAVVLFMSLLASGHTLGNVVREVNRHRLRSASPASLVGTSVTPWILVGNPAATVTGLAVHRAMRIAGAVSPSWQLPPDVDDATHTGLLVTLGELTSDAVPRDARCEPQRWVSGALHDDGIAYVWLGPSGSALPPDPPAVLAEPRITLESRVVGSSVAWRQTLFWLQAGSQWLRNLAEALSRRDLDPQPLLAVIDLRNELTELVEQAACAATPYRSLEIVAGLPQATEPLRRALEQLDQATAQAAAVAVPHVGARLSHLWAPPWLQVGTTATGQRCGCGCIIVGHARRHPLSGLHRMELSCPACSLIGDAAASDQAQPVVQAVLDKRRALPGASLRWSLQRLGECIDAPGQEGAREEDPLDDQAFRGFACASLFDPFRDHRFVSDVVLVTGSARVDVVHGIPARWPRGMSWATLVFVAGGQISMFAFDIDVLDEKNIP